MLVVWLAVAACGDKAKPAPTAPRHDQTLAEALVLVCDSPTRAEADPGWQPGMEAADKARLLGEHAADGVRNARLLAWLKTPQDQRVPELEKLLQEASITSCRLREIWQPAT
jgi:hypothetical protein